jgi:hypothetical protein
LGFGFWVQGFGFRIYLAIGTSAAPVNDLDVSVVASAGVRAAAEDASAATAPADDAAPGHR